MKKCLLLLILVLPFSGFAQNTINNYKYVLVPEKFNFLKQNDQYRLNTLTRLLLEEKGFTVYFDNAELPTEIANNKCIALTTDVLEKNGMFTTNLTLVLKDCQGNIVFKTKEGKSREKEFKTSYNLALRDAFTSLTETTYSYNESTHVPVQQMTAVATTVAPAVKQVQESTPVAKEAMSVTTAQPVGTLYAQPTANGFQLIDTTPKKVLTLLKTSAQDYFIAENGTANGIVLKKNGDWFFEYYSNGQLNSEKLLIKF
jgi:hypothetical protein